MTEPQKPELLGEESPAEDQPQTTDDWWHSPDPEADSSTPQPVEPETGDQPEPTSGITPFPTGGSPESAGSSPSFAEPTVNLGEASASQDHAGMFEETVPVPEGSTGTSESTPAASEEQRGEFEATVPVPGAPGVPEPTAVIPEAEPAEPSTGPVIPQTEAIFREPTPTPEPGIEPTRVQPLSEEEQKLAAERAARRDARTAALSAPPPQPPPPPEPVIRYKRTNDRFAGALGLFLLRVVLAGIFAIRGMNILSNLSGAEADFGKTILGTVPPGPAMWAMITGGASLLIALSLLLGLLTRVAGLGVALIAAGALTFVYWSPAWSPFVPGRSGFLGEYELLLAVVGVLLLLIGGGGWSLDRSLRSSRDRKKDEKASFGD